MRVQRMLMPIAVSGRGVAKFLGFVCLSGVFACASPNEVRYRRMHMVIRAPCRHLDACQDHAIVGRVAREITTKFVQSLSRNYEGSVGHTVGRPTPDTTSVTQLHRRCSVVIFSRVTAVLMRAHRRILAYLTYVEEGGRREEESTRWCSRCSSAFIFFS